MFQTSKHAAKFQECPFCTKKMSYLYQDPASALQALGDPAAAETHWRSLLDEATPGRAWSQANTK